MATLAHFKVPQIDNEPMVRSTRIYQLFFEIDSFGAVAFIRAWLV